MAMGSEESELGDLEVKKQSWLLPGGQQPALAPVMRIDFACVARLLSHFRKLRLDDSLIGSLAVVFFFFSFI